MGYGTSVVAIEMEEVGRVPRRAPLGSQVATGSALSVPVS